MSEQSILLKRRFDRSTTHIGSRTFDQRRPEYRDTIILYLYGRVMKSEYVTEKELPTTKDNDLQSGGGTGVDIGRRAWSVPFVGIIIVVIIMWTTTVDVEAAAYGD